ncbi:MAG TPA: UTP--glucose-1-phosphate uridylyltransferase GalU [Burkholderiales bacterium]|nr:UTP--glucose-1-phosphate uridylyltransferase GalU [Burkholderiales bacterium]
MTIIRKAVFPVAGLGTRFLPMTKACPKEMLPIVDKPLIQYAVEEAVAAGITEMIFITGRGKRAIEDHFDKAYELEAELAAHSKNALLEEVRALLPSNVSCAYIRQVEPLGLGHAVLCARPLVRNEPFAVILADDLIDADKPVLKQMVDLYDQMECSIIGVQDVPREETNQYGIVQTQPEGIRVHRITNMVEKPAPKDAPSTLAVVGRYILTPAIFDQLEATVAGAGGEIQLTDGIKGLLREEKALAYEFNGDRYDCGCKLGYLKAVMAYGMKHPQLGKAFSAHLSEFCVAPQPLRALQSS